MYICLWNQKPDRKKCVKQWCAHKLCFFSVDTKHVEEAEKRRAKEKELAKVSIKKEDVDLIVEEMEISKTIAERTLREHAGNVVEALASLTNWFFSMH